MKTKLIKGLREVHSKYDAFFIDLWGVIHNGIQTYPEAIDVLENLSKLNKKFISTIVLAFHNVTKIAILKKKIETKKIKIFLIF